MARTTLRCIQLGSTDCDLGIPRLQPTREMSWTPAQTQARQLCDGVGNRNRVQQLTKRTPIGITRQSNEKHPLLKRIHCKFRKGNQTLKELSLINNDDSKLRDKVCGQDIQRICGETRNRISIVGADLVNIQRARIERWLHNQHLQALCSILTHKAERVRRLPCKHGTDHNLERHVCTVLATCMRLSRISYKVSNARSGSDVGDRCRGDHCYLRMWVLYSPPSRAESQSWII